MDSVSPLNSKVPDSNPTDPLSWALGPLALEQSNDRENIKTKLKKKSYLHTINIIQRNEFLAVDQDFFSGD